MKTFLARLAVVAVILLLIAIAIPLFLYIRASHQLQAKLQQLRASGAPTTLEELDRRIPDNQNAFLKLTEAAYELKLLSAAIATLPPAANEVERKANENAAFLKFEQQHPGLIARLRAASQLPDSQAPNDYSGTFATFMPPHTNLLTEYRSATRALAHHAEAQLAAGDTDAAIRDAIAILRWGEFSSHEPGLVSFLMSAAIRGVGIDLAQRCLIREHASSGLRDELLATLTSWDSRATWSRTIDSERVIGLAAFAEFPGAAQVMLKMNADQSSYLDLMEDAKEAGTKPWGTGLTATNAGVMTSTVVSPGQAALKTHRRVQSQSRAVQILAAWQDQGKDTKLGVGDLGLPAAVTTDPFDGSVMKLKHSKPGVIIYSVGEDGVDDGGIVDGFIDVGLAVP